MRTRRPRVILSSVTDMDAPPAPPERVRMIEPDGSEVEPTCVLYLGPDPESGLHVFEVWFPPDKRSRSYSIGKVPARTSLWFRFGTPRDEGNAT